MKMKIDFRHAAMILALGACFTSCSDNDEPEGSSDVTVTVDFEAAGRILAGPTMREADSHRVHDTVDSCLEFIQRNRNAGFLTYPPDATPSRAPYGPVTYCGSGTIQQGFTAAGTVADSHRVPFHSFPPQS